MEDDLNASNRRVVGSEHSHVLYESRFELFLPLRVLGDPSVCFGLRAERRAHFPASLEQEQHNAGCQETRASGDEREAGWNGRGHVGIVVEG